MTLIDQSEKKMAEDLSKPADEKPLTAIYRKTARGHVCKTVELTEGFVAPLGWQTTPTRTGDEPILVANVYDEPTEEELTAPAPSPSKKKGAE